MESQAPWQEAKAKAERLTKVSVAVERLDTSVQEAERVDRELRTIRIGNRAEQAMFWNRRTRRPSTGSPAYDLAVVTFDCRRRRLYKKMYLHGDRRLSDCNDIDILRQFYELAVEFGPLMNWTLSDFERDFEDRYARNKQKEEHSRRGILRAMRRHERERERERERLRSSVENEVQSTIVYGDEGAEGERDSITGLAPLPLGEDSPFTALDIPVVDLPIPPDSVLNNVQVGENVDEGGAEMERGTKLQVYLNGEAVGVGYFIGHPYEFGLEIDGHVVCRLETLLAGSELKQLPAAYRILGGKNCVWMSSLSIPCNLLWDEEDTMILPE